jgi:hypothetical protein
MSAVVAIGWVSSVHIFGILVVCFGSEGDLPIPCENYVYLLLVWGWFAV